MNELRGSEEFLQTIDSRWFEKLIPNGNTRISLGEIIATVLNQGSHCAFVHRNPVYPAESSAMELVKNFAEKNEWTKDEKRLAFALFAQKIIEGRIETLRKLIPESP